MKISKVGAAKTRENKTFNSNKLLTKQKATSELECQVNTYQLKMLMNLAEKVMNFYYY